MGDDPQQSRGLELGGIAFLPGEVVESGSDGVVVRVPRADVREIQFRHGYVSRHPVVQAVLSLAVAAVGALPTWHLAHWIVRGGLFITWEATVVPLVFVGPWLFIDAFKRGDYLDVKTPAGWKRLVFDRSVDRSAVDAFLSAVEVSMLYKINR